MDTDKKTPELTVSISGVTGVEADAYLEELSDILAGHKADGVAVKKESEPGTQGATLLLIILSHLALRIAGKVADKVSDKIADRAADFLADHICTFLERRPDATVTIQVPEHDPIHLTCARSDRAAVIDALSRVQFQRA